MTAVHNALGQPIGEAVPNWTAPPLPPRSRISGNHCWLEPLDPALHGDQLYQAYAENVDGSNWTYLGYEPFDNLPEFSRWLHLQSQHTDPLFFAVVNATFGAIGIASYLRISPEAGSIEIGHLNFSPRLQSTPASTEALYLMIQSAFDLGYRRCEWKCNALNEPSCRSALRLGFTFEGIFRQAAVVKQRNRDTAWYSILDREWPALRQAYTSWLAQDNFDQQGLQRCRLSDLTAQVKATTES